MFKLMAATGIMIFGFFMFPFIKDILDMIYTDLILVSFPGLSDVEKAWFTALPIIVLISIFGFALGQLLRGRKRRREE